MNNPMASILDLIGQTPLVEVTRIDCAPCRLFLKLESANPSGSLKDRPARTMIEAAEADGKLTAGGAIVEATAGNTGLGLALVGARKGYRTLLVVPDKMAREKVLHAKAMGAEVITTRSDVGKGHPDYYQDLAAAIRAGRFREDLYYRLRVVPIHIPPLRERPEDIGLIAQHLLAHIGGRAGRALRLSPDTLKVLEAYSWPGNVRQLENMVEMAVALSGERRTLAPVDFPIPATTAERPMHARGPLVAVPDSGLDYEQTLATIERSILEQALRKTGGNKKAAADMLRLKRTTLSAKVRSLETAACS